MSISNLFSITGKVAVVTGGSRGIGYMIARGYVEAGAKVYISSRKKEACDRAAEELSAIGACISIPADLSTMDGCRHLVNEVSAREQAVHILVNNAGANWGATMAEFPEHGFDKVMDTNVKAIFFLTRDFLSLLERGATAGDPARVINIGSIDGLRVPSVDNFSYSASKAAVHHLTRVLAVKLAGKNVTVNAIAPGPFESKMTEWLLENHKERIIANCPLGRIGEPSDMAGTVIYLASRAASYVNGVVLPVDGGICIK